MPPRSEEKQLLLQGLGFDIVAQSQKIVVDISDVIDSKELSFLKERDGKLFLELSNDFQEAIEELNQRCYDLQVCTKAVLKGHNNLKERVKTLLIDFGNQEIFKGFKSKCTLFISNIQNDKDYEEEKRDNIKNLVAGLASMGAAVGVGLLIGLHFVPGVNFLLTISELVMLVFVGVGALISSVVNTYFYKRRIQVLKNDLEELMEKVRKYQEKAREIEPHQQKVHAQSCLDYDEIDYEELDGALEGLTSVLKVLVGGGESLCNKVFLE